MNKITIATHDGNFHADEVFAIAILKLIFKNIKIIRSREPEIFNKAEIKIDIGGKNNPQTGYFDHHMTEGAGTRYNSIPYASCGLVWRHYGRQLAENNTVFEHIDKKIIQSVDAIDSGYSIGEDQLEYNHYNISDTIDAYNPPWYEDKPNYDLAFNNAVDCAVKILENELKHAIGIKKATFFVKEAIFNSIDPRYLVLDKYCPWQEIVLEESEVFYVIFPAATNDWRIRAVPIRKGSFELKKPFPSNWAGKSKKELATITGVEDALFCHRSCFIAGALSKEGAISLTQKALGDF